MLLLLLGTAAAAVCPAAAGELDADAQAAFDAFVAGDPDAFSQAFARAREEATCLWWPCSNKRGRAPWPSGWTSRAARPATTGSTG